MDKIEFENGSVIQSIDTDLENIRSKRGQNQIKQIREYYRHNPYKLIEYVYPNLKVSLYQKIMLKFAFCKEKIMGKLRIRRWR